MTHEVSRRKFLGMGGGAVAAGALGTAMTPAAAAMASGAPEAVDARRRAAVAAEPLSGEPNVALGRLWWQNPRNVWTVLGWPDHAFRFHVFYNGSVVGAPLPPGRSTPPFAQYAGMGVQLDMTPWEGWFPSGPYLNSMYQGHTFVYRSDVGLYGHGTQQWAPNPTPVLETLWPQSNGCVYRQTTFAHIKGGADIVTGLEPIYAWVRLSVASVDPLGVSTSLPIGFAVQLARSYYTQEYPYYFQDGVVLTAYPENAAFTENLTTSATTVGGRSGLLVRQQAGLRVAALSDGSTAVPVFSQPDSTKRQYNLQVLLQPRAGAYVDILLAMLPQPDAEFNRELAQGFDGALAESDAYWGATPATAATISTPEPYVNELIRRNIQFGRIIAEKTPDTQEYTFLTGSFGYDVLWSTPTSIRSHSFFDLLGYHDVAARHLEIYRTHQGQTPPPGSEYPSSNPGYFGTPANLKAVNWITDHGAIMLAASTHALLTGDSTFIGNWTNPLVMACDFIKTACANPHNSGVAGLPPPAVVSDSGVETQSTWMMAWLYKGLISTVRLLTRIQHPRAAEFASFAATFKATFNKAFDSYNATQPTWTDPRTGTQYPVYSQYIINTPPAAFVDAFELDTGAMSLVWGELIDADDPRMVHFPDFFRVGPNVALYGDGNRKNPLDKPVLLHEISSCEPAYSWNVYQSWGSGNRDLFLEGMYSLMTGGMSPQTHIPFEHRHGMCSVSSTEGTAMWLIRNAIVDDNIAGDQVHLLRLCPLAWLSTTQNTVFGQMPTIYGPVSLRFMQTGSDQVSLTWSAAWRVPPGQVVLHFPPGINGITVNGTLFTRPGSGDSVVIPTVAASRRRRK